MQSSELPIDPLSDVLALVKPRAYMFGGLNVRAPWAVHVPADDGMKCYAIVAGSCLLVFDEDRETLTLCAGDCVLVPGGRAFALTTSPELDAPDFETVVEPLYGRIVEQNGGGDVLGFGGYFELRRSHATFLLDVLPPFVHVRSGRGANLRWCIETIMDELREPKPGGSLVAEHAIQLLLLQALRIELAERSTTRTGLLFALGDEALRGAIEAMHREPARRWTLADLARAAHMSRSAFALTFKRHVGLSPIDYLTRWRVLLAEDRLQRSNDPISAIAPELGYESESAFGAAFKRIVKCTPSAYRQRLRAIPHAVNDTTRLSSR